MRSIEEERDQIYDVALTNWKRSDSLYQTLRETEVVMELMDEQKRRKETWTTKKRPWLISKTI